MAKNINSNKTNINLTSKERRTLIYTMVVVALVAVILIMIIFNIRKSYLNNSEDDVAGLTQTEIIAEVNEETQLDMLYDMSEQGRIEYYCAEFFKSVQRKDYSTAYELLYSEYIDNYFPTQRSFEVYMEDYFPSSFSLDYTNIERIGNIYVLWVDVKDSDGKKYGHNFSLNVVIQENDYDDYYLSFSRNSAVESM